jgi:ribosome recycling factor
LDTLEENMMKTEDALTTAFAAIRTGKASPALVENITFEYYGAQTRIRDAAGITAPEPRLLVIQPWDATAVKAIEKALLSSSIGITPMSDGKTLKLPIPELSQERRTALSKQAKASAEDAKVALRNIRRDANDAVKKFEKDGELTEDERKKMLDDVQKTTDSYIAKVDAMYAAKEKELMTV